MYIEKKKIHDKIYYYLKISARDGKKVKTKTIAYLGKEPMSKKELDEKINKISKKKIEQAKNELKKREIILLTEKQREKLEKIQRDFAKKLKLKDTKLKADMFRDFKTYYVYNTTAIEGNSLTLEETNLLLNEQKTPEGKELREIYDHINEKETVDYILTEQPEITLNTIIDIHARLLKNIDKRVGNFRKHNVRVFGADFQTTDAKYVHTDMKILMQWYRKQKRKLHPFVLAVLFHEKFEKIHPFYDGNGRTGRMIMNLMLLRVGLPPLIIKNKGRQDYYRVLSLGHTVDLTDIKNEQYEPILKFCYEKLVETYEEIFSKWG